MERYELSLKDKRDWESAIETAVEEGREKGIQEGREKGLKEVARNLKRTGLDIALIVQATGLTPEEVEKL
ncbi:MAG: hypothetical protein AVDCRST_MAG56-2107 [uncultured Cytophagales bacterium]|uniref:Transposase n=1 Tax=uncultured Cytophagales bacterium TaxID=158755 RepID=A0A6J4ILK3_9SPHI|nr:MAG: hypothetical protein AVDCRST_MAG56-2107 [uncultured Cytophagales bacterium]